MVGRVAARPGVGDDCSGGSGVDPTLGELYLILCSRSCLRISSFCIFRFGCLRVRRHLPPDDL